MGIAIYVEGGGDGANGRAQLRLGFDTLLAPQKDAARARRLHWKLVPCGGRNAAFNAFRATIDQGAPAIAALLVDAEETVADASPDGRVAHLHKRDGWDFKGVNKERVHLMTQCMEAWIVADIAILGTFYGQGFLEGGLPKRMVLDDEPKAGLYAALEAATKSTRKGSYGKIKHASELLKLIRPATVAARCISFRGFTQWLDSAIAGM